MTFCHWRCFLSARLTSASPAPSEGQHFLTLHRARLLVLAPLGAGAALLRLWLLQPGSSHRSCLVLLRRLLLLSVPASSLGLAFAGLCPTPGMAGAPLAFLCDMPHPSDVVSQPQDRNTVPEGVLGLKLAGAGWSSNQHCLYLRELAPTQSCSLLALGTPPTRHSPRENLLPASQPAEGWGC